MLMIYAPPFSTAHLLIWDSLRVLDIMGGIALYIAGFYQIASTRSYARIVLTTGLLCFVTSSIGTEIEHLGDVATYRLFFNLIGTAASGVGMWFARKERFSNHT